jgi:uncharacterized membrane protein YedE/YeeE
MSHRVGRYADPYFAGVGLGLTLLGAYVLVGRGLGASGAFASVVAAGTSLVKTSPSPATAPYLDHGLSSPLHDWLVWEVLGMMLGGFVSAWLKGRANIAIERGPRINDRQRIAFALAGGILMGIGAKFARGCTSGQGLTGGALLSAGSWIFIMTCFAAGYLFAPLARRLWR